jgi:molybdenum cofactor cytidylyltransferase
VPADGGIAAVVLAAGASRRFGEANKLLARIEGRSLIVRVIDAVADSGLGDIVVVTGCDQAAVEHELSGRRMRFVQNDSWETGMGSSIGVGIAALDDRAVGAFVVPGDMPWLSSQLIAALISAFEAAGRDRIVFPTTDAGEQRNPVLWPRRFFAALHELPPATGAKALLQKYALHCLPVVVDDAVLGDVDTPDDLQALPF